MTTAHLLRRTAAYYFLAACFIAPSIVMTGLHPSVWSTTTLHRCDTPHPHPVCAS